MGKYNLHNNCVKPVSILEKKLNPYFCPIYRNKFQTDGSKSSRVRISENYLPCESHEKSSKIDQINIFRTLEINQRLQQSTKHLKMDESNELRKMYWCFHMPSLLSFGSLKNQKSSHGKNQHLDSHQKNSYNSLNISLCCLKK